MKTLFCVFGTRPEAIKMAPVVLALRQRPKEFRCRVVVTAQHRHMLDQVLSLFDITPDHDLDVMTKGQSLTGVTVKVLERLDPLIQAERPAMVLVHGDTTTTMAASLAAFHHKVPVGHVEAGLRSYDRDNPFPEELNRVVADCASTLHFAPTARARQALLREGLAPDGIIVTGNTGIDALQIVTRRLRRKEVPLPRPEWRRLAEKPFVLITAHRRESFGEPLAAICSALADVADRRPNLNLIYPVHPNPNVQGPVHERLGGRANVHLLPPLEYSDFLYFMARSRFIVTDSGGLQEEGPSLGKPVLVLREVTERPEAVRAGAARIVGTDRDTIRRWMLKLLDDRQAFRRMATAVNPYGDGRGAVRTVEAMRHFFGLRRQRVPEFSVK
jgi:UDP-N-acetylglucosamine 2-epimerase (non-hydrolysing)